MTLRTRTLASGDGWYVEDVLCMAGPHDRPFEEQHQTVSLAAVMAGTFQYRTTQGSALLTPGAVLLGNAGRCFECGHEHATGDRCLAFRFMPDYWEDIVAASPGARTTELPIPRLPPLPALVPVIAALQTALDTDSAALEELTLDFAGAVLAAAAELDAPPVRPSARDERRVSDAVRMIEARAQDSEDDALSLSRLAREVGVSPYHFLRTFRVLVGMTPYQYVLRTRMHRAAVRLRTSELPVSTVAFNAGFNDLSTFTRRFRQLMGASPSAYRGQSVYPAVSRHG